MPDLMQGTFHFHSTYSHDGRSTLAEIASALRARGFSFCVMTEHFEDFDAAKFERYLEETKALSGTSGLLLIPGIEVHLSGVDTIMFPVRQFDEIARLASQGEDCRPPLFKVVAHPSKYPFELVAQHLQKYQIQGIELWNQQADGRHIPPMQFLGWLKAQPWRNQYRYFFGCDLHNVNLTVANVILLTVPSPRTAEAVVSALTTGDFLSWNGPTGIEYANGSAATEFDPWLQALLKKSFHAGKLRHRVRRCLKSVYRSLPRNVQHSLNDAKNFVRNKV
jgi:PHP domain